MFAGNCVAGLLPIVGVYKMAGLLPLSRDDRIMFRVFAAFGLGAIIIGAKIIRDASIKVYEKSVVHSHERCTVANYSQNKLQRYHVASLKDKSVGEHK